MSDIIKELFAVAAKARENSYAPYSNYKVGAAIRTSDGQIFGGTNIEEAAYVCTHAEQAAISNMITSAGRQIITDVLVVGGEEGDGQLTTPCGHCRQWLNEHKGDDMNIHVAGPEGLRRSFTLNELLPFSFGPNNLK